MLALTLAGMLLWVVPMQGAVGAQDQQTPDARGAGW